MKFKDTFFRSEELCGFYVDSEMKHVWAAEIEVLLEVIKVCNKYGLQYYADWGTLLGAVRHQGFIPWDDDIDISLKRNDYMKLAQVLEQELPEGFRVLSIYTREEYSECSIVVTSGDTVNNDPEYLERFHGTPYIVGIDIFPLDYIPRDKEELELQTQIYHAVVMAAKNYDVLAGGENQELEHSLALIEQLCGVVIDRNHAVKNQLWKLSDQICQMYGEKDSDVMAWIPYLYNHRDYYLKKEWYDETVELPFENITITAPKYYKEALTRMFGDYMVPVRNTQTHEYPFYKSQKEHLQKLTAGN